jgi:uncharacterized membrane protein HdeD (DUF308 family)
VARREWLRSTRTILNTDAREALDRATVAELRLISRHRVGTYALTIAVAIGVFVFIWRTLGLTVAIVLIGLCLVYGIALTIVAAIRLRRLRGKT